MAKQIEDYTAIYQPEDHGKEWSTVLQEIKAFIEADAMVTVVNVDSTPIVLPHRLTPSTTPPLEKGIPTYLQLTEILVVSNCYDQVR